MLLACLLHWICALLQKAALVAAVKVNFFLLHYRMQSFEINVAQIPTFPSVVEINIYSFAIQVRIYTKYDLRTLSPLCFFKTFFLELFSFIVICFEDTNN
jgi:hypothetical protein